MTVGVVCGLMGGFSGIAWMWLFGVVCALRDPWPILLTLACSLGTTLGLLTVLL